tara:strand:- start:77 stop:751 length:675 start_codon:yes stop_codon:yes gene_type:complete
MAIPNQPNFSLSQVLTEVGIGSANGLAAAFAASIDGYFDPTYKGSKDRLSNFQNYGPPPLQANNFDVIIPNSYPYVFDPLVYCTGTTSNTIVQSITQPTTPPTSGSAFSIATGQKTISYTGGFPSTSAVYSNTITYTIEDNGVTSTATINFKLARFLTSVLNSGPMDPAYAIGMYDTLVNFNVEIDIGDYWYPGGGTAGACVIFGSLQDQTSLSWYFNDSITCI